MINWLNKKIEAASWRTYLLWMALFIGYEFVIFSMPGPWANLIEATVPGSSRPTIPDLMFGFHSDQPLSAFAEMSSVMDDYLMFNALDIPYAFLSMMAGISVLMLALKRFPRRGALGTSLLVFPILYFVSEVLENTLLVLMVLEFLTADGIIATVQQAFTTIKITTNGVNAALGGGALIAILVDITLKRFRKSEN